MNETKTIEYLRNLKGVSGVFITDDHGNLIASKMPEIYDDSILAEIASGASNILETFKTEIENCRELKLSLELKTLYIREAEKALIFVVVDSDDHIDNLRIASNVAAKRLEISGAQGSSVNNSSALASPASTSLSTNQNPQSPPSDKSVSITTALFGRRKNKPAPPKEDEDIWG